MSQLKFSWFDSHKFNRYQVFMSKVHKNPILEIEMAIDNAVNNKRIARNTLFLYGRMLFVLIVSIYTTRVVLSVLGVEDYGIYNVVCGFVSMFGFLNTSLSNGIQRFYNYEYAQDGEDGAKKVFQTSFFMQLCLAILVVVLVEAIGLWYINTKMVIPMERLFAANWIFHFSVLSLVFVILQIPYSAAILAHEKMDYYALVSIVDVILKLCVILVLPHLHGEKLIIYGGLQLLVSMVNFFLYYCYSKKQFCEIVFAKASFHLGLLKSISMFSGWNVLATFAWMTQGQGVNMVINLFFGSMINAARGVSGQIQSAIQGFCENLVIAFRPQLVQTYAIGNLIRTGRMMYSMSKIMYILFFILALPVCIEINYILKLWLGGNIPKYTAEFTILVLISMLPRNFTLAFAQLIHATGKLGKFQITTALIVLLTLPTTYIALRLGCNAMAVYWINLIMCLILFVASLYVLKLSFPIDVVDYLKKVILPCIVVTLFAVPSAYLPTIFIESSFLRLIIVGLTSTSIIAVFSYFIVFDRNEKDLIQSFFKNKK